MLRILSFGCGVQSSTIVWMSIRGDLPHIDHAVFADTGDEPAEVMRYLDYIAPHMERNGINLHIAKAKQSLPDHMAERIPTGRRLDKAPFRVQGNSGDVTYANRDCTREWKIRPIRRKVKEILGLTKNDRWPQTIAVEQWLGISSDEMDRMKVAVYPDGQWMRFRHPLIESDEWTAAWPQVQHELFDDKPEKTCAIHRAQLLPRADRFSRQQCLEYCETIGVRIPPRSACKRCPYRTDVGWVRMQQNAPEEFAEACDVDDLIRSGPNGLLHDMKRPVFIHESLVPLRDVDFDSVGSEELAFGEECSGICGV